VIVGDNVCDDGFLIGLVDVNVFGVEQFGKTELLFSHIEGVVQVKHGVGFGQFVVLDQFRAVFVNNGVESQTVAPRSREISNVDVLITGGFHLTPEQKGVLGRTCFVIICLLNCNVLDLVDKKGI
jgi:hypothetical protein